ncbi:hypothetical protein EUGRSUZ_H03135 [Eucalyptus grandis]|uniref:Uncharacterized protein n=2 Tax=Eucalyptus grandis TaxID=71139 RepID=A0ACC3JUV6_EUCGR|nr:hypothetical protein EUGRSUZ_H03135 [Eucalyptus grandis]
MDAWDFLVHNFHFPSPRHQACKASVAKQDCFILMPIGGGKSLCYQLPTTLKPGVTVVISPLLSLIQDQIITRTLKYGIPSTFLNSQQTSAQAAAVLQELRQAFRERKDKPSHKLLYVTPEMIVVNSSFLKILKGLHRKGLLLIHFPVMALTATATQPVCEDILKALRIPHNLVIFKTMEPLKQLEELLKKHFANLCGIVDCLSKSECVYIAKYLNDKCGIKTVYHHAGLAAHQRVAVVCATIAFGMGIDKPDVRFVTHNAMSKSIESYYQESGRAARDNLPAVSISLYAKKDFSQVVCMLRCGQGCKTKIFKSAMAQARKMQQYCEFKCQRQTLCVLGESLNQKDYKYGPNPCDNCLRASS